MTAGDTQPTQPLPAVDTYAEPEPKRRRRAWPWIVALIVVAGLAVVAWFAGEWIARDMVDQDDPRAGHHAARRCLRTRPIDVVVAGRGAARS